MDAEPAWRRTDGDALILVVHAQPGAKRTEVAGVHGAALKMRIAAPAADGKANAELLRWLAEAFDTPRRNVTLLRGASSRSKVVRIASPLRRPDLGW